MDKFKKALSIFFEKNNTYDADKFVINPTDDINSEKYNFTIVDRFDVDTHQDLFRGIEFQMTIKMLDDNPFSKISFIPPDDDKANMLPPPAFSNSSAPLLPPPILKNLSCKVISPVEPVEIDIISDNNGFDNGFNNEDIYNALKKMHDEYELERKEKEQLAKQITERLAKEKDRLAKIEADRIENERLAREKAEKDRLAIIEANRIAAENAKAEEDRLAKIEADRKKAEEDRLAKEKEEQLAAEIAKQIQEKEIENEKEKEKEKEKEILEKKKAVEKEVDDDFKKPGYEGVNGDEDDDDDEDKKDEKDSTQIQSEIDKMTSESEQLYKKLVEYTEFLKDINRIENFKVQAKKLTQRINDNKKAIQKQSLAPLCNATMTILCQIIKTLYNIYEDDDKLDEIDRQNFKSIYGYANEANCIKYSITFFNGENVDENSTENKTKKQQSSLRCNQHVLHVNNMIKILEKIDTANLFDTILPQIIEQTKREHTEMLVQIVKLTKQKNQRKGGKKTRRKYKKQTNHKKSRKSLFQQKRLNSKNHIRS